MIILRDITDLVKSEYYRTIEKVSDIMIASASHDMKTPLNTIINMHCMLESKIINSKALNWLKVAKSSTSLLIYLVNDTLDYYMIKSGKFSSRMGPVNIQDMVKGCLDLVSI